MGKIILPPGVEVPKSDEEQVEEKLNAELDSIDLKKRVDNGDGYTDLDDWYHDALRNFAFMISRNIPEPFQKHDDRATERFSCEQGLIAFDELIKLFKQRLSGEKLNTKGNLDANTYSNLSDWYLDSMIIYVEGIHTGLLPEKFKKSTDEKTNVILCRAGIRSSKLCITRLKELLNG